ncbi:MAG TPA: polysaccharide biosynthesis tyrosine autokinase, partial [Dysgonamonadaceae bacterium]|nr:polysaccharide biosynthesis tyrosine autokinase [Dysgonamonadaceae bacterium]
LLLAFLYLRYTVPVYNVSSIVLLKHEKGRGAGWGGDLKSIGLKGMDGVSSMDDEVYVLGSISSVRTVVDRLNLHTSYMMQRGFSLVDIYTDSPFVITMNDDGLKILREKIQFSAQLNSDKSIWVVGNIGGKEYDTKLTNLPALLRTPQGEISFALREGAEPFYEPLQIIINPLRATINNYRSSLGIERSDRLSSVLTFSLKTSHANKGVDFLSTLMEVYNYKAIEDKNQEAINTRNFIIERLSIVERELSVAEGKVESYKREQGMTNLKADLMQSLQQSSQYEQQLVKAESQLNIVNSLNEWVHNPDNKGKAVPSNVGLEDSMLAATINEYNQLLAERDRLKRSIDESSPVMQKLTEQIESLRNTINSSIASVRDGLHIHRRNIANQVRIYGGKLGDVPMQERQFLDIAREKKIKAELYMLLLQKREENALVLAANRNNAVILDKAHRAGVIHPNKKIVLLATLLFALLLPIVVIYLLDLLQYKIRTRGDVDRITKVPILGEIPKLKSLKAESSIVVSENAGTKQNEAFRMIRTNLIFSLAPKDKVVVFTSTVPGEGKTFTAINTAISLALLGKKVLLLGMDLRIPRIHEYIGIPNDKGLTTYLSGYEEDVEQLIHATAISEHLWVMPAGSIPPNPAELLSRNSLDELMEKLRSMYDYIMIDSAPVSLVTDTLIINRIADANVYLCRVNYSSKMNLKYTNELMEKGNLKNMLLVINDVKEFYHSYGYGYGQREKQIVSKK